MGTRQGLGAQMSLKVCFPTSQGQTFDIEGKTYEAGECKTVLAG